MTWRIGCSMRSRRAAITAEVCAVRRAVRICRRIRIHRPFRPECCYCRMKRTICSTPARTALRICATPRTPMRICFSATAAVTDAFARSPAAFSLTSVVRYKKCAFDAPAAGSACCANLSACIAKSRQTLYAALYPPCQRSGASFVL